MDSLPLVIQRAYHTFCQPQAADNAPYALLDTDHGHLMVFLGSTLICQHNTPTTSDQILHIVCEKLQTYLQTENPLAGLWLAGTYAANIAKSLTALLKIPVAFANPFIQMTLRPDVPVLSPDHEAPSMLVACSLALRRFDTCHGSH